MPTYNIGYKISIAPEKNCDLPCTALVIFLINVNRDAWTVVAKVSSAIAISKELFISMCVKSYIFKSCKVANFTFMRMFLHNLIKYSVCIPFKQYRDHL